MKRVKVDFSTTVKDGLIRANLKRASEPLHVGDEVEAFDPAEDMEFVGVVDHLSGDGLFAFLRMEWEDAPPAPPGTTEMDIKTAWPAFQAARPRPTT